VLVALGFDMEGGGEDIEIVLGELLDAGKFQFLEVKEGVRKTQLYKTHFTNKNSIPQKSGEEAPKYLALLELEGEELIPEYELVTKRLSAEMTAFKLLKSFGKVY
jgi:hypothetical protein